MFSNHLVNKKYYKCLSKNEFTHKNIIKHYNGLWKSTPKKLKYSDEHLRINHTTLKIKHLKRPDNLHVNYM